LLILSLYNNNNKTNTVALLVINLFLPVSGTYSVDNRTTNETNQITQGKPAPLAF
jgi:hypothetical protein